MSTLCVRHVASDTAIDPSSLMKKSLALPTSSLDDDDLEKIGGIDDSPVISEPDLKVFDVPTSRRGVNCSPNPVKNLKVQSIVVG